jgi:hypothetical protein
MKEELSKVSHISLTADVWRSPTRVYFMCLTCHYLNPSMENKSMVLSFRRFVGQHTGLKMRAYFNSELRKMNMQDKVRSITTDAGSDIKCATQRAAEFGVRIQCAARNLNLVVKNALWLFEKKKTNGTYAAIASAFLCQAV